MKSGLFYKTQEGNSWRFGEPPPPPKKFYNLQPFLGVLLLIKLKPKNSSTFLTFLECFRTPDLIIFSKNPRCSFVLRTRGKKYSEIQKIQTRKYKQQFITLYFMKFKFPKIKGYDNFRVLCREPLSVTQQNFMNDIHTLKV